MSSAQVVQTRGAVVQTGNVSGAHVNHTDVKVKDVSVRVEVPTNCFSMTNHMLTQIKDYLPPGVTLKHFTFFPYLQWMIFIAFLLSFLAIFAWVVSIIMFCIVLVCFALTCQYVHVCCKSLPWLRLVPVIDGLTLLNSHIEVEVNHIEGTFLKAREAGLGQVVASSGKIKFLVMKPRMAGYIARSRVVSMLLFMLGFVALILTIVFLIANCIVNFTKDDCSALLFC